MSHQRWEQKRAELAAPQWISKHKEKRRKAEDERQNKRLEEQLPNDQGYGLIQLGAPQDGCCKNRAA